MVPKVNQIRARSVAILRHRRTRKIAIWIVSTVAVFGILFGLIAPPLIRSLLADQLSKKLHREVSIEQIKINPYAMTIAVRGFLVKQRESPGTAFSFDELFVNLNLQSLLRVAPVIEDLRLVKPYLNLVRNTDYKYNFQDLIDEFTSGPAGPKPSFAVYNIQISDGKADFDDRPEQTKHAITGLKIGIPFLSSLPSDLKIKVKPEFAAVVNGAPFHFVGDSTTPFADTIETSLALTIANFELAKYMEYSPVELNFTVPSGRLDVNLTASFRTSKNQPPRLALTGNLAVKDFAMQSSGGEPLVKLPALDVSIDNFDVFAKKLGLKTVAAQGLELHVARARDGSLNFSDLVTPPAEAAAPEPKQESNPFVYRIDEIAIDAATIHLTDEQPPQPYKTRLENFTVKLAGLSNEAGKQADVELSFESAAKEKFSHHGMFQLTPLQAQGKIEIAGLRPGALRPYYQDAVAAEIKEGLFDLSTEYSFAETDERSEIKLTHLNANLRTLRLELAGESQPLFRIVSLALKDGNIDLDKKSIVIGALEGKDGVGYVQRGADGRLSYEKIVKPAEPQPEAAGTAKKAPQEWQIEAKRIALDRFKVTLDDRTPATPVKLSLSDLSLRGENLSNAKNHPGMITVRARVNDSGSVRLAGPVGAVPFSAKLAVGGGNLELLPFQPYIQDQVNFLLTGGRVQTKGNLIVDAANSPLTLNYDGSLNIADFAMVEKSNAQDLLKWKSLNLDAIEYRLEPFRLRIGEISLAEFYSRLILGADGKINLQNLVVQKEEPSSATLNAEKPAQEAPKPAATGPQKAISIGKINLQSGNVNFSDYFIKPNYSANLTDVQGSISELKPDAPGTIDLQAKLNNAAPVLIKGKVNPLAKEIFLDLVANATDIELSPLTPYSAKYVGYGIEKGKLSFNVKYKLDNRKLNAENKFVLNQLTFGDKVESPDATQLPVLLAVALLKDRNGVIDVDLPISGSLDDPQFSVGGIVWRIIVNIITKAVTAPFSLLAGAFGGGSNGEDLSYIEFGNGRATINQAGQAKIATLARALNNRPALRLEITGRVDPTTDRDGLLRAGLERKVKAQKLKDLVRRGEKPKSLDDVVIEKSEYAQYLKAAYGEESFPKPRNFIGLARDLPVAEMEKLMLQHAKVGDEELRQLADRRAQTVREALLASGQVDAERLLIVAAKPLSNEEKSKMKGRLNRVDFAMK